MNAFVSYAHEPLCPQYEGADIQLMHLKEHNYMPENVQKRLMALTDYINGALQVSDHFMPETYEIIEGGILMRNVRLGRGDIIAKKKNLTKLCNFIKEQSLIH